MDNTNIKTMCFTAASKDGVTIWGSKVASDDVVVAQNVKELSVAIPSVIYGNVELDTNSTNGAVVTWSSSNENIISQDGIVNKPSQDEIVTLTLTVSKGEYCYKKDYDVLVKAAKQNGRS